MGFMKPRFERWKDKGFTQEQVTDILDDFLEFNRSPEDIRNDLMHELSYQEKLNYRAVGEFIKGLNIQGVSQKEIMTDSALFKMANQMYMMARGPRQQIKTPQTGSTKKLSDADAIREATDFFKKTGMRAEEKKRFIKDLAERAENKDLILKKYKAILKR